jgi:hypothetical protein
VAFEFAMDFKVDTQKSSVTAKILNRLLEKTWHFPAY